MKLFKVMSIFLILFVLKAEKTISGFDLLNMSNDAVSNAMSGTAYLKNDNKGYLDFNPATLQKTITTNYQLSYSKCMEDAQIGAFSVERNSDYGAFGADIAYFNMDNFEGRLLPSDDPDFKFDATSVIISGAYANEILKNLYIGTSAKYLAEKIAFDDAYGFALSGGFFYNNLFDHLNLSLALNNWGKMNKMLNEETKIPFSLEAGMGANYKFNDIAVFGAISNKYLVDDEYNSINFGLEASYINKIFIRAGYRTNNDGLPFSIGTGFKFSKFQFDYSYSPFTDDMGDNHVVSVLFSM